MLIDKKNNLNSSNLLSKGARIMEEKKQLKVVFELFSIFLYVSVFTVGGGIAMVPLLERILVDKKKYLKLEEFMEIYSISQIVPGSLMICMATYIGYKIRRFWGAIFSCMAIIIPPLAIITMIAFFYQSFIEIALIKKLMLGILCGVVGEVGGIIYKMFKRIRFNLVKVLILFFSITLIFIFKVNPIYTVLIAGIMGIFLLRS
jgi:chromate transporter